MADEVAAAADTADVVETTQPVSDAPPDQQQADGTADKPEAAAKPESDSNVIDVSKHTKEVARTARALQNLQAENAKLKDALQSKQAETPANPSDHPALKGLKVDEDGEVEVKPGKFVSADDLIERYDLRQQIDEQNKRISQIQNEREESQFQAKMQDAANELMRSVETAVSGIRAEALPGLSKEHSKLCDEYMFSQADRIIVSAMQKGDELTPESIEAAGKAALEKARALFGIFGTAQLRDNAEYKDKNKVKPGGQVATKTPADLRSLSKADRNRLTAESVKAAEAASSLSG